MAQQGLNSFSTEAGVYVDLTVNNLPGKFVVDTGATVSLISKRLFYAIPTVERPALSQIRQTVLPANGTALSIEGKGVFSIQLASCGKKSELMVTDLSADGILGMDFLKQTGCQIDLVNDVVNIYGEEIPLQYEGRLGCYRVCLTENISIQQKVIRGCIKDIENLRVMTISALLNRMKIS